MEGKLSGAEQAELGRLENTVSQIEGALTLSAVMDAGTVGALNTFLAHLQDRIAGLQAKGQEQAEEERTKEEQEGRISALVERERALNEVEKQEYAALLREDHFKKADFGRLEHFYSNSFDKLTEGGKDEMSHRVWEGVRQHEYRFSELPGVVKEKEAQRVELGFTRASNDDLAAIPAQDKSDFLDARAKGQKEQSYSILDRPSFTQHVAVSKEHRVSKSAKEETTTVKNAEAKAAQTPPSTKADDAVPKRDNIKFDMGDLKLVDGNHPERPPLTGYAANTSSTEPAKLTGR